MSVLRNVCLLRRCLCWLRNKFCREIPYLWALSAARSHVKPAVAITLQCHNLPPRFHQYKEFSAKIPCNPSVDVPCSFTLSRKTNILPIEWSISESNRMINPRISNGRTNMLRFSLQTQVSYDFRRSRSSSPKFVRRPKYSHGIWTCISAELAECFEKHQTGTENFPLSFPDIRKRRRDSSYHRILPTENLLMSAMKNICKSQILLLPNTSSDLDRRSMTA